VTLPEITIDMDGVICRPTLWLNLAISRDVERPLEFPHPRHSTSRPIIGRLVSSDVVKTMRYAWRPAMPRLREGLASLAEVRRLVLLTGRPESTRHLTEQWLVRHRVRDYFAEVVLNDRGLPNASFKLLTKQERGGKEHVDDDGRVAYFLARDAGQTVFLISYTANASLPYPSTVRRVGSILEAARLIHAEIE
jgi:uncharacterized HAD superfamily protein